MKKLCIGILFLSATFLTAQTDSPPAAPEPAVQNEAEAAPPSPAIEQPPSDSMAQPPTEQSPAEATPSPENADTAAADLAAPAQPDSAANAAPAKSRKRFSKDKSTAEQEVDVITTYKGDVNQLKSPKKAFFLSFLLPGLGEYYAKAHPIRIAAPLMIEAASYTVAAIFYGKYNDKTAAYKKFTDTYYSHEKYKTWYDTIIGTSSDIISVSKDLLGSHAELYDEEQAAKSNDYYEMISKYPSFVQGWNDADPDMNYEYMANNPTRDLKLGPTNTRRYFRGYAIDSVVFTLSGGDSSSAVITDTVFLHYQDGDKKRPYFFGKSENQLQSMRLRDEANTMGDYVRLTFVALLVNRIASAVDAVLAANAYNRHMTGGSLSALDRVRLVPAKFGDTPVPCNGMEVRLKF